MFKGETEVLDANGKKVELPANVSKREIEDGKYIIVMTNQNNKTLYGVDDKNISCFYLNSTSLRSGLMETARTFTPVAFSSSWR